ncbi:MAG: DUF3224 domain-containing protein [Massilia sp.]
MNYKRMAASVFCFATIFESHALAAQSPRHASGSMEVVVTPAAPAEKSGRTATGRMILDKQYTGDLVGTGKGEMLTAMTDTKGSAAYVAMERVSGRLDGRSGSFVIAHRGSMRGNTSELTVQIVPDSGTGELTGIAGTMTFERTERGHVYQCDYVLP